MGTSTRRHGRTALAAVAAAIAATGALALPATSAAAAPAAPSAPRTGVLPAEATALAAATGTDATTATARVAAQRDQAALAGSLGTRLGAAKTAGSYLDGGKLVVTVTDAAAARTVTAAGATAEVVARSTATLDGITTALDKAPATPGTAWGVDAKSNQVVVTISSSAPAAKAAALEATAKKYGPAVRVQRTATGFGTQLAGGEAIYTDTGGRCSAGFNTTGGVVTAGHCTAGYPSWTVGGGGYLGESAGTSFPGDDYGLISNSGQPASNSVYLYGGGNQVITGAGNAVAGQSICKSGSTTGVTCGTVQATGVTVNYAEGAVYDTVQTNVCTQPGDSGGSWFSGSTAIGITSGGTIGGCDQAGFRSFFQPVTEALSAYGVSLI